MYGKTLVTRLLCICAQQLLASLSRLENRIRILKKCVYSFMLFLGDDNSLYFVVITGSLLVYKMVIKIYNSYY